MDQPKRGARQAPPTKRARVLKGIYIAVAVIAVVIVLLFTAYRLLARRPQVDSHRPGVTDSGLDGQHSRRKKDFFTFLVVGRDTAGGGNTDVLLLAAYDVPNQALSVMSIPRDTLVNIDADIKKINAVYNYAGGGEEGIAALKEEVGGLVGFLPDFYVVVEWKAVGELVDALGGVWYDVPQDMYYQDPYQDLYINVSAGYQKLDGDLAMQVVRYRSGYATGDIGRIETQQGFLKAVVEQCLKVENVTWINSLAKVFTDNVTTDLSVGDLAWLGEQAIFGGLDMENVSFATMPWVSASGIWSRTYRNYPSYVAPDIDALVAMVNEGLNPFVEPVDKNELDIMYVNDDGTLGCTSGRLEDQAYNIWVQGGSGGGQTAPATQAPVEAVPSAQPEETQPPSESQEPAPSEEPGETQPGEPAGSPSPEAPDQSQPPEEPPLETPPAEPPAVTPEPTTEPEPDPDRPPEGIPLL